MKEARNTLESFNNEIKVLKKKELLTFNGYTKYYTEVGVNLDVSEMGRITISLKAY